MPPVLVGSDRNPASRVPLPVCPTPRRPRPPPPPPTALGRPCSRSPSAPSGSCSATSAPARSTPCARPSRGRTSCRSTTRNVLGVLSLIFWALIIVIAHQVPGVRDAGRQRGRGRHPRPHRPRRPDAARRGGARRPCSCSGCSAPPCSTATASITPAISVLSAVEGVELAAPDLDPLRGADRGRDPGRRCSPSSAGAPHVVGKALRPGDAGVVRRRSPSSACSRSSATRRSLGRGQPVVRRRVLLDERRHGLPRRSARCSSWSPAARRCTPTWATSGASRSSWPGSSWCCRRCCSTTSARARSLLDDPEAIENPFFRLAPEWALYPLVVLATAATIIASQALISGVFSLTHAGHAAGLRPAARIRHTSATAFGQVYVPLVNWALMIACIALVIGFRTSANLAAAYGMAVTATMVITTHPLRRRAPRALGMGQARAAWCVRRVPGRRPGVPRRQPVQDPRRAAGSRSCRRRHVHG